MTNKIEFEDYTEDYLIEDGALYLVDSASGYTAVMGIVYENGQANIYPANDPFQDTSFDDTPDRIAKLFVQRSDDE